MKTTDEMDSTTPEERDKLVACCGGCFEWVPLSRAAFDESVHKCGGRYLVQTLRSLRTFDQAWAKKETVKLKRKYKK